MPEKKVDLVIIAVTIMLDMVIQKYFVGKEAYHQRIVEYLEAVDVFEIEELEKEKKEEEKIFEKQLRAQTIQNDIASAVVKQVEGRLEDLVIKQVALSKAGLQQTVN